jgi:ABC-type Zn uptake system ZnuABC Zn-binding protein ZnuA
MMRMIIGGVALVLAMLVSHAGAERMVAIASIFPVADIVERVGGGRWEVFTLIPAGASAHTYEPTPEQVRLMSRARIFFRIGLGLEFWLEKLVQAAQNRTMLRVDLSEGIETLPTPEIALEPQSHQHRQRGHGHQHGGDPKQTRAPHAHHYSPDPHYWLDPVRMQAVATRIEQVLSEIDPDQAAGYREQAQQVRHDLDALHHEIEQATHTWRDRRFIAMHSAWTYFAARYHLDQVAVIEPFPGREPAPRYLADLTKLMRREGVKAVVIEPQLRTSAAQALARETGAKLAMLDPTGGAGVPGRANYFALLRYNVAELVKLLH